MLRFSTTALALIGSCLVAHAGAMAETMPPRSASDIVAMLRTSPPLNSEMEEARRILDAPIPETLTGTEKVQAWTRLGRAAEMLGLNDRYLQAYRTAWEASGRSLDPAYLQLRVEYTAAEIHAGNWLAAIAVNEETALRAALPGYRLGANAFLADNKARHGDDDGAARHLNAAEADFSTLQRSPQWGIWGYAWEANVERARGSLAFARGKFAEAEAHYRTGAELRERDLERNRFRLETGRETATQKIAIGHWLVARKNLADVVLAQGRLVEAELLYRDIISVGSREFGTGSPLMQMHLDGLTMVLLEQGRAADARELASTTLDILQRQGTAPESRMLTATRLRLAAAHVAAGRWAEARTQYDAVAAILDRDAELKLRLGRGNKSWALTLMRTGDTAAAVGMMENVLADDARRYAPDDVRYAESVGFLAMTLAQAGKTGEALERFRQAVPVLLRTRLDAGDEGLTAAMRRQVIVLEAYLDLLAKLQREGRAPADIDVVAESFRVADVARGSAVQRALLASAARAAIRDPRLAELAREEQDLSYRISTLTETLSRLASAPADQRLDKIIADMRRDIPLLKQQRQTLRERIARDFPDYEALVNPKPLSPSAIQGLLAEDEAMLAFYAGETRSYVWAIPRRGEALFLSIDLPAAALRERVSRLRASLDPGTGIGLDLAFDLAGAHELYSLLVRPALVATGNARQLLVISHGALGQLPLALLPTQAVKPAKSVLPFDSFAKVPWLIRDYAITQLPTAATLAALRRPRPSDSTSRSPFLGFGDPVFSAQGAPAPQATTRGIALRRLANTRSSTSATLGDLAPLPDTADELRQMAAALNAEPTAALRLGNAATESAVRKAALQDVRVIAFATHGLTPGDLNGLSQPALALSNPALTGETDVDGLLTMEEILGLRLNADWVVLSACNTAAADGQSGEALSGLGRAFFYAGTRALIATNWPVETVSARLLTSELFRRQASQPELTRAQALRAAMLAVMEANAIDPKTGKAVYSYAHPLFWSPYSLIGDGGR